ncbi:hypothetical protein KNO15_12265 [Leifsonia shinshuensis]|uniref:hypothetical protein n=1 Tax=Leifsonia shinshuensis TaxID=150026 RepID=UPI001F50D360|nr:hypothetical protein [Leifsonia shinshuensis]MCI0157467.1 hypothetical protein [Leifsonia shinshuensis]
MTTNADDPTSGPDETSSTETSSPAVTPTDAPLEQGPAETISLDEAVTPSADTISLDEPAASLYEPVAPAHPTPAPAAPPTPTRPPVHTGAFSVPPTGRRRPPVRWAGIVWGVLLAVFAAVTLFVVSSPARLAGVTVWVSTLTPGAAWALWIALLGLVIVVSALLGAIGAAQRSRRRRTF